MVDSQDFSKNWRFWQTLETSCEIFFFRTSIFLRCCKQVVIVTLKNFVFIDEIFRYFRKRLQKWEFWKIFEAWAKLVNKHQEVGFSEKIDDIFS